VPSGDRPSLSDIRKRIPDHGRSGPVAWPPNRTRPDVGKLPGPSPGPKLGQTVKPPTVKPHASKGKPDSHARANARFPDRVKSGQLDRLTGGKVAQKIKLADQYKMKHSGDVARRLHLHDRDDHWAKIAPGIRHGIDHGRHHAGHYDKYAFHHGRVSPHYAKSCFRHHYWGHHHYVGPCWYPRWGPWVSWSWHHHVHPFWDPRPLWCRPIVYHVCPRWTWWQTPIWVSLPVVTSGTWIDVPSVVVAEQFDLQVLAVRFVDPGHPEEKLGPRYRIWFRNNSDRPIAQPFNVLLMAGLGEQLVDNLPQAGVRVTAIEAGDTQSVDVRLPIDVYAMGQDAEGKPMAFDTLHVLVDSHREVNETSDANNGTRLARTDVLPVDPAAFELEPVEAAAAAEVLIAGEGFGPQPGQVLVHMAGLELEGEILGWYDLGVRVALPNLPLASPVKAELIVVRGDGIAANPLSITVLPPRRR